MTEAEFKRWLARFMEETAERPSHSCSCSHDCDRERDAALAEIERLQGRLKASGVIDLMRRAEKAEAENERLREALLSLSEVDWKGTPEVEQLSSFVRHKARAALGGEEVDS